METDPVVIDCLEFNDDLRLLDTASEIAFLALECDRLGRSDLSRHIIGLYAQIADDDVPQTLWAFYTAHHALIRAMVAIRHTDDAKVNNHDHWRQRAMAYLNMGVV
jgi:aminoglycoside phosphotransferase family enzyme